MIKFVRVLLIGSFISICPFALSTEPISIANPSILDAYRFGPEPIRKLLVDHLTMFPGSFKNVQVRYPPLFSQLAVQHENLKAAIKNIPTYFGDLDKFGTGLLRAKVMVEREEESDSAAIERSRLDQIQSDAEAYLTLSLDKSEVLNALRLSVVQEFSAYLRNIGNLSKTEPLKKYEERAAIAVMLFAKTKNGTELAVLNKKIEFADSDLNFMIQENTISETFSSVLRPTLDSETFYQTILQTLKKQAESLRPKVVGQKTPAMTPHLKNGEFIYIFQVPPDLAILRGLVGDDNSTSQSFGFPYSPYERVYYIADSKGQILGYASLSIVEFQTKLALYLHTISGPKISPEVTDLFIRGIFMARHQMGFEFMLLPEDHRIRENNDFPAVHDVMLRHAYTYGKKFESVKWLDEDYRRIIVLNGSSPHYDSPDRNRISRLIQPNTAHLSLAWVESCSEIFKSETK